MKTTKSSVTLVILLFVAAGVFWVRGVRDIQRQMLMAQEIDTQRGVASGNYNGFDVSNAIIPRAEIRSGGPPRDGIPSIDNPKFIRAKEAGFLQDQDEVIGLKIGNEAKAYPLRILVWHEIVNDQVGDDPVAVTYCPLCATAMAFERDVNGRQLTFGVSGLLYNSDVLMYDRQTDSLWSQLAMKAVSGPLVGTELNWLPAQQMNWKAWRERHPDSLVLSTNTGFERDYSSEGPYTTYHESPETMFPVPFTRPDLPRKTLVLGVIVDNQAKAYPLSELAKERTITDQIGERTVRINYDSQSRHAQVTDLQTGGTIPSVQVYWFAWQAFYPNSHLFQRPRSDRRME